MNKKNVILLGAGGMLSSAFELVLTNDNRYIVYPYSEKQLDITDYRKLEQLLFDVKPDIIINCAAYTFVDKCESEQELAYKINGEAVGVIAKIAQKLNAVLVHFSTDYVFDGNKNVPYNEQDKTNPINVYGKSKLIGEKHIIDICKKYYILRISWLYGPNGNNFVDSMISLFKAKDEIEVVNDQIGSPTYTFDVCDATLTLLGTGKYGIYNFTSLNECSWYDFSCEILNILTGFAEKLKINKIIPVQTEHFPRPAKRPKYSVLDKTKFIDATGFEVPKWEESLLSYIKLKKNGSLGFDVKQ